MPYLPYLSKSIDKFNERMNPEVGRSPWSSFESFYLIKYSFMGTMKWHLFEFTRNEGTVRGLKKSPRVFRLCLK